MATPEPTVRVTRYTVTCVPADASPDAHVWAITVEEQRDGKWLVNCHGSWLDAKGEWHIGYSGVYKQCAHDLDTALRLAREHAPLVEVNGYTVADALARFKGASRGE